jgi:NAD(P)-dependent dehydrogenase (short-subunit alcohol dehydrogenase family)
LAGKVALIAGATGSAGRGIACGLGEAGATVYCTGRTSRRASSAGYHAGGAETIEETAAMVDRAGGIGIPVHVDHRVNAQAARVFARVRHEQRQLDILVNVARRGPRGAPSGAFWKRARNEGRALCGAVWPHVLTCQYAAPLMVERRAGLIIEFTERDARLDPQPLFSDLGRVAQIRLACALAKELAPYGVTALAVTRGHLPTEARPAPSGGTEAPWRRSAQMDRDLMTCETPGFVGRVVVALATDPNVAEKAGGFYSAWGLATEYGFIQDSGR